MHLLQYSPSITSQDGQPHQRISERPHAEKHRQKGRQLSCRRTEARRFGINRESEFCAADCHAISGRSSRGDNALIVSISPSPLVLRLLDQCRNIAFSDQHRRQPALPPVPEQFESQCPCGAQQEGRAREIRPRNDHQIQRPLPFPFRYQPPEPRPLDQERVQCFGPKPCHAPIELIIRLNQPLASSTRNTSRLMPRWRAASCIFSRPFNCGASSAIRAGSIS